MRALGRTCAVGRVGATLTRAPLDTRTLRSHAHARARSQWPRSDPCSAAPSATCGERPRSPRVPVRDPETSPKFRRGKVPSRSRTTKTTVGLCLSLPINFGVPGVDKGLTSEASRVRERTRYLKTSREEPVVAVGVPWTGDATPLGPTWPAPTFWDSPPAPSGVPGPEPASRAPYSQAPRGARDRGRWWLRSRHRKLGSPQ